MFLGKICTLEYFKTDLVDIPLCSLITPERYRYLNDYKCHIYEEFYFCYKYNFDVTQDANENISRSLSEMMPEKANELQ